MLSNVQKAKEKIGNCSEKSRERGENHLQKTTLWEALPYLPSRMLCPVLATAAGIGYCRNMNSTEKGSKDHERGATTPVHWRCLLGKQTTDGKYDSGLQNPCLHRKGNLGTDRLFPTIQELGGT